MAEPKEVQAVEMAFPEAYLMACTSLYPCPLDQAHLNRLKDRYDGYSDHTRSLVTAAICTAFGAFMYETHFTLDKDAPGPDHAWSRDPSDLAEIVQNVAEAEAMFGSVRPLPGDQEQQNRRKWRVREGYLRSG
jgi:sialic acid synthase SpsE